MTVVYHPEALLEYEEAVSFYEERVREVEVILLDGFQLREPGALDPALERTSGALRGLAGDEVREDLEEGPALARCLVEDFLVGRGDAGKPQGFEIA